MEQLPFKAGNRYTSKGDEYILAKFPGKNGIAKYSLIDVENGTAWDGNYLFSEKELRSVMAAKGYGFVCTLDRSKK